MQTSDKENFKNDSKESSDKWDESIIVTNLNKENLKNDSKSFKDRQKKKNVSGRDRMKKFYEDHPELAERITCPECGITYQYAHKGRHYKSKNHKYIVTSLELEKIKKQLKNTQGC